MAQFCAGSLSFHGTQIVPEQNFAHDLCRTFVHSQTACTEAARLQTVAYQLLVPKGDPAAGLYYAQPQI